jgi:hypothetical protein
MDTLVTIMRTELGRQVKNSTIPGAGFGLFTTCAREKGERIVPYEGKLVHFETDYSGPYVLQLSRTCFIDAQESSSGVGRYANCCRGGDKAQGFCVSNNAHDISSTAQPR